MIGEFLLLGVLAASGTSSATDSDTPPPAASWPEVLRRADEHGLAPAAYAASRLLELAADPSPAAQAEYSRVLGESIAAYRRDVSRGRLTPATADPDWHIPVPRTDLAGVPAAELPPPHADYRRLKDALARYRAIQAAGGWPAVPPGPDLRGGDRDPRAEVLRNRLRITGDYAGQMGADPWFFDADVDEAVRRFQGRHGLPQTGVFDERTSDAANVPVADRIDQLGATMERWRWLPRDLGPRFAWVNTAGATLEVLDAGETLLAMRTIVGHPTRATPSFASQLRQVVFNPAWSVPRIIAVEDLLPRQQEDITFLPRQRIRVFSSSGTAAREVDATRIDWRRVGPDHFPYMLRQDPGPWNSLGRVKFAMDSPFDIYLHDTPAPRLFDLTTRTLGSGCVRLANALALANLLLRHDRDWKPEDTTAQLARPGTRPFDLRQPLPIYLVYLTAWVTPAGEVNFRRDIYGRDRRLLRALPGKT